MFLFVTDNNDNIHVTKYYYLVTPPKGEEADSFLIKLEEAKQNKLLDYHEFETLDKARTFMEDCMLEDTKSYTKLYSESLSSNDSDILSFPDKIPHNCRYIFVNIEKGITPNPGFYKIPLNEYVILKENYNDYIRLPLMEEYDLITKSEETVMVHSDIYKAISQLFIVPSESFVDVAADDNNNHGFPMDKSKRLGHLFRLILSGQTTRKDMRKVFGNLEDNIVDAIHDALSEAMSQMEVMHSNGSTNDELCEFFCERCKEVPLLAKDSKNIVGMLY